MGLFCPLDHYNSYCRKLIGHLSLWVNNKLLENTGLVSIVMLMTLNCISQQDQMKLLNYLSKRSVLNVKDWMTNNCLLLNSDKTKNSTQNLLDHNLQLDRCTSSTVKYLRVILDSNLSF